MTNELPYQAQAQGQRGSVTREQALAGGLTNAALRRRNRSGDLVKNGVRTYTSPLVPRSVIGDLHALMLDVGDSVWACGRTSAALHGLDGYRLESPFHLLTLRGRNVRRAGHHIHSTLHLPLIDRCVVNGLAATTPTRTLIDLAATATPAQLTAALDSALRDGLTSEDHLHRRITDLRSSGRYGIPQLLAVIEGSEITRGGHSWLERRFLELVASADLPRPRTQVVLAKTRDRLVRVDAFFDDADLVVELLGYRWHRTKAQMSSDAARANAVILQGKRLLQFTYDHIAQHPDWVLADLATALRLRAA